MCSSTQRRMQLDAKEKDAAGSYLRSSEVEEERADRRELLRLHGGRYVVEGEGGQRRRKLAQKSHFVDVAVAEKEENSVGVSVLGCKNKLNKSGLGF